MGEEKKFNYGYMYLWTYVQSVMWSYILHAYKYHNIYISRNTDHFKKQQNYKQAIEQEMQFKPSINKNVGITSNGQEARNNIVELKLLLHILWQFL